MMMAGGQETSNLLRYESKQQDSCLITAEKHEPYLVTVTPRQLHSKPSSESSRASEAPLLLWSRLCVDRSVVPAVSHLHRPQEWILFWDRVLEHRTDGNYVTPNDRYELIDGHQNTVRNRVPILRVAN